MSRAEHIPDSPTGSSRLLWPLFPACVLLGWAYLPTLGFMYDKWVAEPQYSHGFLVPLFSIYLLTRTFRTGVSLDMVSRPRPLVAVAILTLVLGMRMVAGGLLFHQLDVLGLLVSLFAMALAVGGVKLTKLAAPAILFLIFMVPLPYEIERNVGGPLKMIATQASTYLLQTLGLPAIAEGNVILIDDVKLGVVDACNGLSMLMTFTAFGVGAVLMTERTKFEKAMILLGIAPIAVLSNVLRITVTGVVYTTTNDENIRHHLHDKLGLLMMPLGLAFLAWQLWALSRLVVRPADAESNPGAIFARVPAYSS